ncbi:hypothetical protein [Bradyrhizobium valentinum]|uniref:hypothetical protein n=1 Tax=Bradyrhizobium valentinum TaxID=1518501 RepID=UPI0012E3A163|nr:hypothetical protein [Bradyrhizobium valentinum]
MALTNFFVKGVATQNRRNGAPPSMEDGHYSFAIPYDSGACPRPNQQNCDGLRCTTPHGWASSRFSKVWLPFDSGRTDQSGDRRDVPELTSPYPAAGFRDHMSVRQVLLFAPVAFSHKVVHIRLALQEAGTRFRPDKSHCRDGVAVLHQSVHALRHVSAYVEGIGIERGAIVWQRFDLRSGIIPTMLCAHHRSDFVSPLDHVPTTFGVSAFDERGDLMVERHPKATR